MTSSTPMTDRAKKPVWPVWVLLLSLVPLLSGGVVVGDEAQLFAFSIAYEQMNLGFREFLAIASYAYHHLIWFVIVLTTKFVASLFTSNMLIQEAVVSMQTVTAALCAVALCYTFLVRKQKLDPATSALTILTFFAGSYGLFITCMGEVPECYMALAMAARLFWFEDHATKARGQKLAIADAVLIAFKAYSVVFVVFLLPLFWAGATKEQRKGYALVMGVFLVVFAALKLWTWSPPSAYVDALDLTLIGIFLRFVQQFISPWTGLAFCLPIILVLFFHDKADRRTLLMKGVAVVGCMAFFSLYIFFDGDHPGGRYVFPFLIVFLPEIGNALKRIFAQRRKLAWLAPVLVLIFLPVGSMSLPFTPALSMRTWDPDVPWSQRCLPEHPATFSWKMVIAKVRGAHADVCLRGRPMVLDPRDAAIPRTGPGRIAFILTGGLPHDYTKGIGEHRGMALQLETKLQEWNLNSLLLWRSLEILPGAVIFIWTLLAAAQIARRPSSI